MSAAGYRYTRAGLVASLLWLCAGHSAAADPPAAVKIAVFPFELEDFSAASKGGENPYLAQATEEAKKQLAASGRYSLVDTAAADMSAAKGQALRECGGCEAAIARKLGADQALIGVVSKISNTEYLIKLQISDARSGEVISKLTSELRMGADYSWSRGVRSVMKNDVLSRSPSPSPSPSQPPGD